jgi:hypothetical protein
MRRAVLITMSIRPRVSVEIILILISAVTSIYDCYTQVCGHNYRYSFFGRLFPHRLRRLSNGKNSMDELNGRMIACQILITGLIARVANDSSDPLSFLSDFRDEIKAVVSQVRIGGASDQQRVRETAQRTVDELFSLMKPPSVD